MQQLMWRFSTRKYGFGLLVFADGEMEAQFTIFIAQELIDLRLSGSVALTLISLTIFCLFLTDAVHPDIPLPCVALFIVGICLQAASVILAVLRRNSLFNSEEVMRNSNNINAHWLDFGGPALGNFGTLLFSLGGYLAPDSVLTNETGPVVTILIFLVTLPNLHLPSLVLTVGAFLFFFTPNFVHSATTQHNPVRSLNLFVAGSLWFWMFTTLQEMRLRVQFIEKRVTQHVALQQQIAVDAQEAVLASIVPDFVIAPLMTWLASDFDPLKTVAQQYDSTCVAFLRMSPAEEPDAGAAVSTSSLPNNDAMKLLAAQSYSSLISWHHKGLSLLLC